MFRSFSKKSCISILLNNSDIKEEEEEENQMVEWLFLHFH